MRPVLFYLPSFQIPFTHLSPIHVPIFSYGVMLGVSLIVGWYIVLALCERDGIDREEAGHLYMWTAVASVSGARLLYVLTNLHRFDNFFQIFKVWEGGLVAYGGFIAGLVFGIVYCKVRRIRLLSWADCVVPSLGTGLAFTRIGCFMFGCDFGKPTLAHWAVQFPKNSLAWQEQLENHQITADALQSLPVHPTQIYECLIGLSLFGIVMLVRHYRRFSGQPFVAFTVGYGVLRFYVETLRADDQRGEIGPFSTSQFIGIVSSTLALGLLVYLWREYKKDPASMRYWELPRLGTATPIPVPQAPAKRKRRKRS